jgi:hypothetical protein
MNAMIFVISICPQSSGDWKPQRKGAKTQKKAGNYLTLVCFYELVRKTYPNASAITAHVILLLAA